MTVPVIVRGQRIIVQDGTRRFAPRSQKFIRFSFDFSDDWNGMTVSARWIQGENTYSSNLDGNNCVYLPSGISSGTCIMVLRGTGSNNTIGTTLPLELRII